MQQISEMGGGISKDIGRGGTGVVVVVVETVKRGVGDGPTPLILQKLE